MSEVIAVPPQELGALLSIVLARPGATGPAGEAEVRLFLEHTETSGMERLGWAQVRGGRVTGAAVALLPPGGTAMVAIGAVGALDLRADAQLDALQRAMRDLAQRGLYFAQCLLEPDDAARRGTFEAAGFQPLASLEYLDRSTTHPWTEPVSRDEAQWITYREGGEALFRDVVTQTYVDTRDCVALCGLRPVEATLASHRAVGRFDPALWLVAQRNGAPAGVLLLARLEALRQIEVVYMGVVAANRRGGTGAILLRQALDVARRAHAWRLALVVDSANVPARRLYERFSFSPTARRDAFIYTWRKDDAGPR